MDATASHEPLGWVREKLRCPVTGTELHDGVGPDGVAELVNGSTERPLAYPIHDGVPVLLPGSARPLA